MRLNQDFEGQKLAELVATSLLILVGVRNITTHHTIESYMLILTAQALAFIIGYLLQDIKLSLFGGLGGVALVFVAVVPAWPFYNKNRVKWLSAGYAAELASNK